MVPHQLDSYRPGPFSFIPTLFPYYFRALPRFHNPCVRTCLFVSAQTVISLQNTSTSRHLRVLRPRPTLALGLRVFRVAVACPSSKLSAGLARGCVPTGLRWLLEAAPFVSKEASHRAPHLTLPPWIAPPSSVQPSPCSAQRHCTLALT